MSAPDDRKPFDAELRDLLKEIGVGPEVVGCDPCRRLVLLFNGNIQNTAQFCETFAEFVRQCPPEFAINTICMFDALYRFAYEDGINALLEMMKPLLRDVFKKIAVAPPDHRTLAHRILRFWFNHRVFSDLFIDELKDILHYE